MIDTGQKKGFVLILDIHSDGKKHQTNMRYYKVYDIECKYIYGFGFLQHSNGRGIACLRLY